MSRVVLGVGGGIAAYKAADLLRKLTEAGHDVTVVPTAAALEFVGAADLGGALAPSGRARTSGPTPPRCRTCGSAARPTWSSSPRPPPTCSPAPRTGWPTTCSPTPCSPPGARCCSRRRCTPRCGSTRPPSTTSPPCAGAARSCSNRPVGRLTGADTGKGRLPEPVEIAAARRAAAAPRGRAALRPRRPARAWSAPAAPARRSIRCASSATRPRASRATRSPRSPPPAARGSRWSRANVDLPDPAGVDVVPVVSALELRDAVHKVGRGRRRRGDGRGRRRLPARRRRPATRSRRTGSRSPPIELDREPGRARRAGRRPASRPGDRRVRRRDRRRHRDRARARPRQAGPQGLRPARRQRGRRGQGVRPVRQRRR